MKKILSLSFVPMLVAMLVISSCDKKKDPTPTKEQLLARSTGWKQTAVTLNGVDIFSSYDACEKDDVYKFTQTGSTSAGGYTIDEGASKCDSADPQTKETGTWALGSDKTTLTVTSDGVGFAVTINTLTATSFSFTQSFTDSGVTYTFVQTFTGI